MPSTNRLCMYPSNFDITIFRMQNKSAVATTGLLLLSRFLYLSSLEIYPIHARTGKRISRKIIGKKFLSHPLRLLYSSVSTHTQMQRYRFAPYRPPPPPLYTNISIRNCVTLKLSLRNISRRQALVYIIYVYMIGRQALRRRQLAPIYITIAICAKSFSNGALLHFIHSIVFPSAPFLSLFLMRAPLHFTSVRWAIIEFRIYVRRARDEAAVARERKFHANVIGFCK